MAHSSWRYILLLGVLLSSCGSDPSPTPTETIAAIHPLPAPIDTLDLLPTATFTGFEGYQTSLEELASPDGRFTARTLVALPTEDQPQFFYRLEIEGSQGIRVIREGWSQWAMGYSVPAILGWSSDGRFMYFADRITPDGCSFFHMIESPMRLAVPDGLPETLGLELYGPLSLSPDGSSIATVQEGQLVVADVAERSQERSSIQMAEGAQAGGIVWSPQGDYLAFSILSNPCRGEEPESLIFVSPLPILNPRMVFRQQGAFLRSDAWLDGTTLLLRDFNNQLFELDLELGELMGE